MFLVMRKIGNAGLLGPMTEGGVRSFARLACMQGVTTATDLVNKLGDNDVAVLEAATAGDDCRVRILPAFQAFHGTHGAAAGRRARAAADGRATRDRLRYGLVKMMLDGSIQGFSARLRWPGHFNGAPNGIWVMAPAQYEADFETYHRAGLTIHTHTNGDEASLAAIDAIERVLARAPRPDHRHTLQHGQMIDAPMFRRMAALGLCANLFANHLWYWGDQHYEMTMGPDRAAPARRLRLRARRRRAAGDPFRCAGDAARPAVHSPGARSTGSRRRAACSARRERLTVPQALHAITLGPAWTLKLDHEIGSIECGKRADFCVLEDDPLDDEARTAEGRRASGAPCSAVSGRAVGAPGMSQARRRVPLTVVGGFLGAGKTTLAQPAGCVAPATRRASPCSSTTSAQSTIDAALIASRTADAIALTNGCVCCQIGDDLMARARAACSRRPSRSTRSSSRRAASPTRGGSPRSPRPSPASRSRRWSSWSTRAPPSPQSRDPLLADTLERQLRAADLVVVNKIDLVDAAARAALRAWLDAVAAPAEVIETTHADVAQALLVGAAPGQRPAPWTARSLHDAYRASHGEAFERWAIRPGGPLPARALRALLKAMPAGVLRLKGIVRTDGPGWSELQFAGRHGSLRRAHAAPADGAAAIVAIGLRGRLPAAALDAAFAAIEADAAADAPAPGRAA